MMRVRLMIGRERKRFSLRMWVVGRLLRLAEWLLNFPAAENGGVQR